MDLNLTGQIELGYAPQCLAKNFFLDFKLMFVVRVLIVAPSTNAKVGATGQHAMSGGPHDVIGRGSRKPRLLLDKRGLNLLSRKHEGDEYGFATRVGFIQEGSGRKASQSVAAINQFFNV